MWQKPKRNRGNGNEDLLGARYFDATFDAFPADFADRDWIFQESPRRVEYPFVRRILHFFQFPILTSLSLVFSPFSGAIEQRMLDLPSNRD